MTHELALIGKPHASEVLKVLEGLEVECEKCKGNGTILGGKSVWSKEYIESSLKVKVCPKCNGRCIFKYTWTPRVGEWCIHDDYVELISAEDVENHNSIHLSHVWTKVTDCTPILEWEVIEEILEKAGYYMSEPKRDEITNDWIVGFSKFKAQRVKKEFRYYKDGYVGHGNSRQLAVMKAVERLGKEMK